MKGMELPALLFSFMFMVGVTFILAGLVVWVINAAPTSKTYSMVVTGIHEPIKHQNALMAYLEATYSNTGKPMKDIIQAMAVQNASQVVWLDTGPVPLSDLATASNDIFSEWLGNMPYVLVLNLGTTDYQIAGSEASFWRAGKISLKKVSAPVFTPLYDARLELYVGE